MSENKIKDGGPAFPVGSGDMRDPVGMTLRDYFAAKAMQAIVSFGNEAEIHNPAIHPPVEEWREQVYDRDASTAYRIADAMLRAREPK